MAFPRTSFCLALPVLLLVLLILPFCCIAHRASNNLAPHTITPGSSLIAHGGHSSFTSSTSSWVCPSGDFAFGFRPAPPKRGSPGGASAGFLLAIWFNKIPENTIVWTANGDHPVPENSKVHFASDGSLMLTTPNCVIPTWTAGGGAAYAAMRDDGNFVLLQNGNSSSSSNGGSNVVIVWQSFDHPTDTLLPTQTLSPGFRLVSRFSSKSFSSGRFRFPLQTDGNLVLYTTDFPLDSNNFAYWATGTTDATRVGPPVLVFSQTGALQLRAHDGTVLSEVFKGADPTGGSKLYQRAVLEYSGVLVRYVYDRTKSGGGDCVGDGWTAVGFVPDNICTSITEGTGGGACGFNSYCNSSASGARPVCRCAPGYELLDPEDELGGCGPGFEPQWRKGEEEGFELTELEKVDWPLGDYGYFQGVGPDWCRDRCSEDCLCGAAIHRNGECWKKKMPLSNGREDSRIGVKAFIKVAKKKKRL